MTVALATAKAHMRVEHDDEDTLIAAYLAAAHAHLGDTGVDMSVDPLPAAVGAAVLLLTAHLYENREATGSKLTAIPFGIDRLIAPHREAVA